MESGVVCSPVSQPQRARRHPPLFARLIFEFDLTPWYLKLLVTSMDPCPVSDLLGSGHNHKWRKQLQTVELKVRMDCEGCEGKVRRALSSMKGVKSVDINLKQEKALEKAVSTGKKAEIWPYVPYSTMIKESHNKKVPPCVRNVESDLQ